MNVKNRKLFKICDRENIFLNKNETSSLDLFLNLVEFKFYKSKYL